MRFGRCSVVPTRTNWLFEIKQKRERRHHSPRHRHQTYDNYNNNNNNNIFYSTSKNEMRTRTRALLSINNNNNNNNNLLGVLNDSTKFIVSASAMLFLLFHPTIETCWCLLGSIVNSLNGKLLKRILNHSRPSGAKKIDPGMPSSHATSLSFLSLYAFLAFSSEPNAFGLQTLITRLLATAVVGIGAFLAYLRVKLGFHTWPQVLVGYGLGSFTALFWFFFAKVKLTGNLAPDQVKNLHAVLVIAIGLFCLSAIQWVKEQCRSRGV